MRLTPDIQAAPPGPGLAMYGRAVADAQRDRRAVRARAHTEAETAAAELRRVVEAQGEPFLDALAAAWRAAGDAYTAAGGQVVRVVPRRDVVDVTIGHPSEAGSSASLFLVPSAAAPGLLSHARTPRGATVEPLDFALADGRLRVRVGGELLDAAGLARHVLEPLLRAIPD